MNQATAVFGDQSLFHLVTEKFVAVCSVKNDPAMVEFFEAHELDQITQPVLAMRKFEPNLNWTWAQKEAHELPAIDTAVVLDIPDFVLQNSIGADWHRGDVVSVIAHCSQNTVIVLHPTAALKTASLPLSMLLPNDLDVRAKLLVSTLCAQHGISPTKEATDAMHAVCVDYLNDKLADYITK